MSYICLLSQQNFGAYGVPDKLFKTQIVVLSFMDDFFPFFFLSKVCFLLLFKIKTKKI